MNFTRAGVTGVVPEAGNETSSLTRGAITGKVPKVRHGRSGKKLKGRAATLQKRGLISERAAAAHKL